MRASLSLQEIPNQPISKWQLRGDEGLKKHFFRDEETHIKKGNRLSADQINCDMIFAS